MPGRNRPIGRGRIPFRKGRRWVRSRPKRWNAQINNYDAEIPSTARIVPVLVPRGVEPAPPVVTFVSGQVDVEPWADEQEVTLDRLIGAFSIRATEIWDSSSIVDPPGIYVKLGILVNEEMTEDIAGQTIAIFEQERLEDYEWMWLWGGYLDIVQTRQTAQANMYATTYMTRIELDIGNRRKIGQSDELNLYAQFLPDTAASLPLVELISDVRTILMSK